MTDPHTSAEAQDASAAAVAVASPPVPPPAAAAPVPPPAARRIRRLGATLRTHWFFTLVCALGLTGRILTMVAYRPALLYIDSFGYLANTAQLSPTGSEPIGYPLMLRLLLNVDHDFALVAAVQHLMGLAAGVCIYLLLLRHRMPKTLAALASMPVLLDAYEWEIEQNLLTDSLFLVLIAAALIVLTWRLRPGPRLAAGAGLLLGLGVTVRAVGEVALIPALLFVILAAGPTWRRRVTVLGAFVVAAAVPIVSYSIYSAGFAGAHGLRASNTIMLYGRTATIADCASLPADLKSLCPSGTVSERQHLGSDYFQSSPNSPYFGYEAETGQAPTNASQFSWYVIEHQPLRFAEAVGHDFLELFISPHGQVSGGTAVARWQFQTTYPEFAPLNANTEMAAYGQSAPTVNTGVAQLLRDYQLGGGYTPDVLYAIFLLAGLGGALGLTRTARRSGLRLVCALWTGTGVLLLLAADVFEFSWRYQLPALVTLPIGGAFGIAALAGFGRIWPPMKPYPEPSDAQAVAEFRAEYGRDYRLPPVVVLIAAYNEADAIGQVIDDLPDECLGMELKPLIVVDGATDDTARISREHGAPTCVLPVNRGQGAALRVGYHLAYEMGARYIVTSDGDGQYDAGELPALLRPVVDGSADLVIGSRVLGGRENRDLVRHAGVHFYGFLVSLLTRVQVSDTSSGWRSMRAVVPVNVTLTQAQYQTSEFLIGALAKGYRVANVPMAMRMRSHGSTKKGNNLVFGLRYFRVVLGTWAREYVRPRLLGRERPEPGRRPGSETS